MWRSIRQHYGALRNDSFLLKFNGKITGIFRDEDVSAQSHRGGSGIFTHYVYWNMTYNCRVWLGFIMPGPQVSCDTRGDRAHQQGT